LIVKKAIFITVRCGSTRLPRKALLEINNKPTIEYLIDRVKRSKYADAIVLCTTDLGEDKVLCDIAKKKGIFFFQGSVKDKLDRWLKAAEKFDVDFFVTADGDDLFCEPELIDLAFYQFMQNDPDFIESSGLVSGAFTYGIKTLAVKKACEIKDTDDTEMMWVYFKDTGLFKIEELHGVPDIYRRPEIRMTLDYEDDFKFFNTVIKHFDENKKYDFSLRDIIAFLDKNPETVKINQYLQERFLSNQRAKTRLVIKKGQV